MASGPTPYKGETEMRRSSTATFRFVAALLWIAGAFAGPAEAASAKLLLVGVEVDDSAANNDGWLEPGETVNLKVELYNDGDLTATSISGQLSYQGTNPAVTILDPTATWPDLPAKGAPALTDPPHFQVQVGSALACGAVLPFRLTATTASG